MPAGAGLGPAHAGPVRPERIPHQQDRAAGDGRIGHVESRPVLAVGVNVDKIDHRADDDFRVVIGNMTAITADQALAVVPFRDAADKFRHDTKGDVFAEPATREAIRRYR